jgi:uncharacterized damage-inducible protein DinB
MSNSIDQLRRYNDWANQILIDAFRRYQDAIPASCLRLLSHLTNAQTIWVSRITGIIPVIGVWEDYSLADCEKHHMQSSTALSKVIANYLEGQLTSISYTNTKNESFTNSLQDILLHIFNHATYHRAQIATEMRKHGLEPVNTDYITFARLTSDPNAGQKQ